MGQIILSNVKLWVGAFDMSGKLNAIAISDDSDMLDNTTFGMTAKSRKKGMDVITAALAGFWEKESDEYFSTLGAFIHGLATGGGTTSLIDTTKNFLLEKVAVGSMVYNNTDDGQTQPVGVTSISTTTNPNDTLNFAALTAGSFAGGGDAYTVSITPGIPMTVAPEPTIGGSAYSFLSQNVEYKLGGSVGEMLKFNVKSEGVGQKMIRGHILENGVTARIANGNTTTAIELDAPVAGQYLYGVLHVLNAATDVGDTLDVIIQSDDELAFGGSPETQLSFTQVLGNVAGGKTYEWAIPIAAGAITDTFWRAKWTIVDAGADNASFSFVCFMGID
jgi:hypothetical protein